MAFIVLVFAVLSAFPMIGAAARVYDFPPIIEDQQDRSFKTQSEVFDAANRVLERYSNPVLARTGILDVKMSPYSAKGDGRTDDTRALQRAMKDARDARLVMWFPPGTYLVNETLQCVQNSVERRALTGTRPDERLRANDFPCVLQGPVGLERAVIRLKVGAPGFGDAERPKPLLLIWARNWNSPFELRPNMSYNQAVMSIDLDIRGSAGAIGIDMQGAQGTVVEDVVIDAAGAFAGMRGLPGSGGRTSDLTVRGGQYGVYAVGIGVYRAMSGSQPAPLLSHAVLLDQTVASIEYSGRGPLTVVGASIRGAGIVCRSPGPNYDGALNMVDSVIDILSGSPAIRSDRPVYLNRTYVRGAAILVALEGKSVLMPSGGMWTLVGEFAAGPIGPFPVWIDGARKGSYVRAAATSAGPSIHFLDIHALPQLPNWNDFGVANVVEAPYFAKGDGRSDDTLALQKAIDKSRMVFLPKGRYKISRPLILRADSVIFGVRRDLSEISPISEAPAFSDLRDPSPLLETVDDSDATTTVALLQLKSTIPGAYALRWRAGRHSAVRSVGFVRWPTSGVSNHAFVLVEGNGGGRWFNLENCEGYDEDSDYRHLLVRNTREPMEVYMLNLEYSRSSYMAEFVNVANISIYSLKGETIGIRDDDNTTRPLISFRKSRNFRIFGLGGVNGVAKGSSPFIVDISDSSNFLLSNFSQQDKAKAFDDPTRWGVVRDIWEDGKVTTPGSEYFVLYRRGSVSPSE
jgi:hypothetical protein